MENHRTPLRIITHPYKSVSKSVSNLSANLSAICQQIVQKRFREQFQNHINHQICHQICQQYVSNAVSKSVSRLYKTIESHEKIIESVNNLSADDKKNIEHHRKPLKTIANPYL
jgi:hypothetical protein